MKVQLTPERAAHVPWYPVVLVAAYILTLWIDSGVSFLAIWRALAVSVVAVGAAMILLTALIKRPHLVAALVTAAVAVLISRGAAGLAGVAILLLAVPLAILLWSRVRGTAISPARMTMTLNMLSLFVLAVVVLGGVPRGSHAALLATDINQGANALGSARRVDSGLPSIMVILLDGYPRTDVLDRAFGFDNTPFIRELEKRGFHIASQSTSNYPYTQATLISMFHMRPLSAIPALDPVEAEEEAPYPRMRQVANRNPVFDELRDRGYLIVATSPGYEHVTLRQADVFLDNGSLNEPERHLIRGTGLQLLIDAVDPHALADQHRQRITAGLRYADEIGGRLSADGPVFAFVHVPSPHIPVVLDADGGLLPDPPSEALFRSEPVSAEAREAYIGQLKFLNERSLIAIDRALDGGSEPIVVMMSDHGAAPPPRPGEHWTPDHYANLMAIRTPESIDVDLPMDATPVNLFPRLFSALFGGQHPEWPDERFPWVDVPIVETTTE